MSSSKEYNDLLKFLYFEGYTDSYAEAEELLESMSDEEFEGIVEATAMAKRGLDEPAIRQQIAKNTGGGQAADRATALADKQVFKGSGSARDNLARKQRGDFRNTTSSNPGLHGYAHKATTPAEKAKQAARGAQRSALTPAEKQKLNMSYEIEGEMTEATYRTTVSGRKVRWDEDEAIDNAVSDRLQRQREAAAKKTSQERMKAKGTVPTKNGKPVFEEVAEYLFVEGFADTIESAEIMAENISEDWVDEILDEKYVRAMDSTGKGADRRAHTTDPTVRPMRRKPTPEKYKHSEADFDSTLRSPGARKRKEERRQGVGGFREEYEEIDEMRRKAHSFPLKPSERRSVENIRRNLDAEAPSETSSKSAKMASPQEQPKRKRTTDMSKVIVAQYLYSEGYANTIQFAEVMAENISEDWVNEILEAYVELSAKKKDAMTNRANKLLNKDDWNNANKIEKARTHDPEASKAKERANRERR